MALSAYRRNLKQLGIDEEYQRRKKAAEAEGIKGEAATNRALAEMGCTYLRTRGGDPKKSSADITTMTLEQAIARLPSVAKPEDEWKWLASHPALLAGRDIGPLDILKPPHWPCPSKSAANRLIYFSMDPKEFFKHDLKGRDLGEPEKEKAVEEVDVDLKAIQTILDDVRRQAKERASEVQGLRNSD